MTSDRKNVDKSCKQRESGYGGSSMAAAPSDHVLCSGLQVLENGGSPPRPNFLKSKGNEKAAAEDDSIAQDWLTALKPTRAFDSLIGNSGTRCGSNINSSSTSGLMNSQRIAGCPSKHAEALQLCTEGLGFESSDETDSTASSPRFESCKWEKLNTDDQDHFGGDTPSEVISNDNSVHGFKNLITGRAPRPAAKNFPPPLPSIARNGQSCVMMKSYKKDGRFVLQEVKVPSHEVLHALRSDGRLKLQLVQQPEEQKDDKLFKCITPNSDDNIDAKIGEKLLTTISWSRNQEESAKLNSRDSFNKILILLLPCSIGHYWVFQID